MIYISAKHEGLKSFGIWAMVCLGAMVLGPIGTGVYVEFWLPIMKKWEYDPDGNLIEVGTPMK